MHAQEFEVFDRLVSLPRGERAVALASMDLPDDLASRVRRMLEADEESLSLDRPAAGMEVIGAFLAEEPVPTADLPALSGCYQIIRRIGEGGFGIVYEAEQRSPRRRVALKALRPSLGVARPLERLRREAEVLGRLQHSGIAQVYEAGIADETAPDQAFIAMEFVDGPPITRWVVEQRLARRERVGLFLEVCDAVAHAHARGVIHRDLKPANVLVNREGQAKVLDFGVARVLDPLQATVSASLGSEVVGSLGYMSPEQTNPEGSSVDARSDVYALGAMLYELLLEKPYRDLHGLSLAAALERVRDASVVSVDALGRMIGKDLAVIISKALHPEQERRYSTVAQFAEDLRRHQQGRPIEARRDAMGYVAWRMLRRHWVVSSLAGVLTVAVGLFAVLSSWQAERYRQVATQEREARGSVEVLRTASDLLNQQLQSELARARIERGRLESLAGNGSAAESILWTSLAEGAVPTASAWAVWELHHRYPLEQVIPLQTRGARFMEVDDRLGLLLVVEDSGRVVGVDMHSGEPVAEGVPQVSLGGVRGIGMWGEDQLVTLHADGHARVWGIDRELASVFVERLVWRAHEHGIERHAIDSRTGLLVTAAQNGEIRAWLPTENEPLWSVRIDGLRATALITSNGEVLVGSRDRSLRALDIQSGSMLREIRLENIPTTLHAAADERTLVVLDYRNLAALEEHGPGEVFFRSKGDIRRIVNTTDGDGVVVCDALSMAIVGRVPGSSKLLGSPMVVFRDVGVQGSRVYALDEGDLVRVWDSRGDAQRQDLHGHAMWAFGVDFSPCGERLVSGAGDGTVRMWDARSGETLAVIHLPNGHRSRMVRFSPDGAQIAVAASDGVLRILDGQSGAALSEQVMSDRELYSVGYSPDGRLIAYGSAAGSFGVVAAQSGELLAEHTGLESTPRGLVFSPDGRKIYSSGGRSGVLVWETEGLALLDSFTMPSEPWSVDVTPDGKTLASGLFNGQLAMVDLESGAVSIGTVRHHLVIAGLRFSNNGQWLATAGEDGGVILWDTASDLPVAKLELGAGAIPGLAWSSDDAQLAAGTSSGLVAIWDLRQAWQRVHRLGPWALRHHAGLDTERATALLMSLPWGDVSSNEASGK